MKSYQNIQNQINMNQTQKKVIQDIRQQIQEQRMRANGNQNFPSAQPQFVLPLHRKQTNLTQMSLRGKNAAPAGFQKDMPQLQRVQSHTEQKLLRSSEDTASAVISTAQQNNQLNNPSYSDLATPSLYTDNQNVRAVSSNIDDSSVATADVQIKYVVVTQTNFQQQAGPSRDAQQRFNQGLINVSTDIHQSLLSLLKEDCQYLNNHKIWQVRAFSTKHQAYEKVQEEYLNNQFQGCEFANKYCQTRNQIDLAIFVDEEQQQSNQIEEIKSQIEKLKTKMQFYVDTKVKDGIAEAEKTLGGQIAEISKRILSNFETQSKQIHVLNVKQIQDGAKLKKINIDEILENIKQLLQKLKNQETNIQELKNQLGRLESQQDLIRGISSNNASFVKFHSNRDTLLDQFLLSADSQNLESMLEQVEPLENIQASNKLNSYNDMKTHQKERKMIGAMANQAKMKSFSNNSSSPVQLEQVETPDLVFFYSAPLVDYVKDENNQEKLVSTSSTALSVELEYKKLVDILRETGKDFKVIKSAINWESLTTMIARKPKIIHISCHGDFCKEKNEFYLQFEEKGKGIATKFYESELKNLLVGQKNHGIKLAFVSACHSEKIGQIFQDCGIPVVIAVNSETQIADQICLIFSRHLYLQLLEGQTVIDAFENARVTAQMDKENNSESCCCGHQHDSSCKWLKYALKHGYRKAHELHSGQCACKLRGGMHKKTCQRYVDFNDFLMKEKEEDKKPVTDPSNPFAAFQFDADFDFDDFESHLIPKDSKTEGVICCCKPEEPHDETMKFVIKGDEEKQKQKIFKKRPKGDLIQLDKNHKNRIPQFNDNFWLHGRNELIHMVVQMLTDDDDHQHKLINIYGKPGLGKKNIAQQALKYCFERNYFQDGAFQLDVEPKSTTKSFLQQLLSTMRLNYGTIENLTDTIRDSRIAIIINQCQELLTKDRVPFGRLISELLGQTSIRIIMIMHDNKSLDFIQSEIYSNLEVLPLEKFQAAKLLKLYDKKSNLLLGKECDYLVNHDLFKNNELTNQQILQIYRLLSSKQDLDDIAKVFFQQNSKEVNNNQKNSILSILYKSMEDIYGVGEKVQLLHLLCQAPSGLLINEIKALLDQNNLVNMNRDNCEEFLESMLQESDQNEKLQNEHGFKFVQQNHHESLNQKQYTVKIDVRNFINSTVLLGKRTQVLDKYFDFFALLGRKYVRDLKMSENQDFDLEILSAEIDEGLWNPGHDRKLEINDDIYKSYEKFSINEINFLQAFDTDLIINRTYKNQQMSQDVQKSLEEIYLTFVSILIMQNRHEDAIQRIEDAKQICENYKMDIALAKLNIIQVSLEMSLKGNIFQAEEDLLEKSYQMFKSNQVVEGQAEIHFLTAVSKIQDYIGLQNNNLAQLQNHRKTNKTEKLEKKKSFFTNQSKQSVKSIRSIGSLHKKNSFTHHQYGEHDHSFEDSLNPMMVEKLEDIEKKFNEAEKIFSKKDLKLCLARNSLYRAEFYLEYDEKKFKSCLDQLQEAQKEFENTLCIQHQVTSLVYISQILFIEEKFKESKESIMEALQLANTLQDPDSQKAATDLLDEIQHRIYIKSNNFIVFLSGLPLIEQAPYINVDLEKMIAAKMLIQLGKNLSLKSGTLNKKQLQFISEYGCKILLIGQKNEEDPSGQHLCIENEFGGVEKLSAAQFKKIMTPEKGKSLNVGVVFLNIQNGEKIGQVFIDLGVKNVFVYKNDQPSKIKTLIQQRLFKNSFAIEMILALISEKTFKSALGHVKQKLKKDYDQYEIDRIKWLRNNTIIQKDEKLYDSISIDYKQSLLDGSVEIDDWTKTKGPTNIEKVTAGSIIGRENEMYQVINQLLDKSTKYLSIVGDYGVGKTKFVQEIAKFIIQRQMFKDGIYYLDFSHVSKQNHIDTLFQRTGLDYLLKHTEKKSKDKRAATTKQILLIYDNVDEIEKDKIGFKWHLLLLMRNKVKIQIITTKKERVNTTKYTENDFTLNLRPLNEKQSALLVQTYCLRSLPSEELSTTQKGPYGGSILGENQNNAELVDHPNIEKCQGNPQALMLLAFVLRNKKMYDIKVERKKINRLSFKKTQSTKTEREEPSSLTQFKEKLIKQKVEQKIGKMILNFNTSKKSIDSGAIDPKEILIQKMQSKQIFEYPERKLSLMSPSKIALSKNQSTSSFDRSSDIDCFTNDQKDGKDQEFVESIPKLEEKSSVKQASASKRRTTVQYTPNTIKNLNLADLKVSMRFNERLGEEELSQSQADHSYQSQMKAPVERRLSRSHGDGALIKKMTQKKNNHVDKQCKDDGCKTFWRNSMVQIFGTFERSIENGQRKKFNIFENLKFEHVYDLMNIEFNKFEAQIANMEINNETFLEFRQQIYTVIIKESEALLMHEIRDDGSLVNHKFDQIVIAQDVEQLIGSQSDNLSDSESFGDAKVFLPDKIIIQIPTLYLDGVSLSPLKVKSKSSGASSKTQSSKDQSPAIMNALIRRKSLNQQNIEKVVEVQRLERSQTFKPMKNNQALFAKPQSLHSISEEKSRSSSQSDIQIGGDLSEKQDGSNEDNNCDGGSRYENQMEKVSDSDSFTGDEDFVDEDEAEESKQEEGKKDEDPAGFAIQPQRERQQSSNIKELFFAYQYNQDQE